VAGDFADGIIDVTTTGDSILVLGGIEKLEPTFENSSSSCSSSISCRRLLD